MAATPKEESNEVKRAQYEIDLVGLSDKDSDYGGMIGDAVMQLIRLFSAQGHSGFSASMTGSIFYRLVQGKALTPVTSDPDEWLEVTKEMYPQEKIVKGDRIWQNKRQYSVFSKDNGKTWEDMEDHTKGTSISREEALDAINDTKTDEGKQGSPESTSRDTGSTEAKGTPEGGRLTGESKESIAESKDSTSAGNEKESRNMEGTEQTVVKPQPADTTQPKQGSPRDEKGTSIGSGGKA